VTSLTSKAGSTGAVIHYELSTFCYLKNVTNILLGKGEPSTTD